MKQFQFKRLYLFMLLFLLGPAWLRGQQQPGANRQAEDTFALRRLRMAITDSLVRIDSLWYRGFYNREGDRYVWQVPDSARVANDHADLITDTLKAQIARLNATSPIEIIYHPALEQTIRFYLSKRKAYLEKMFGLAETYYFPLFEEKLADADIPLEIKYLPIIESALNPKAESPMGARGLWQFMYFTGKRYGLDITSYLDERFSPERSTQAAIGYLNDLYSLFKDWNLVLAAYNSGPGNVTKAIRRSGGYKNYWNLRPFLPRETAGYVPQFLAVWFLHAYKDYYGIHPRKIPYDFIRTDTIRVKENISFDQLHALTGIPREELEFLNPQYKLDIVPYVPGKNYALRLPYYYAELFKSHEDLIYAAVKKDWQRKEEPLPQYYKLPNYVIYRVRPGDCLGCIAHRYRTSISKIKRWNRLRSNRLRIGQKLKIYTRYPTGVARKSSSSKAKKSTPAGKGKYIYHTVRPGDSLWQISRKYGVSVRDLQRWNRLKNTRLKPGTKLKIYKS